MSVALAGCAAGPAPQLFPQQPVETRRLPDGCTQSWYATTHGDRPDYFEQLSPQERIVAIGYAPTRAEQPEVIKLDEVPPAEYRHLVLLLDSIPFQLVEEAWHAGKFRLFEPPTRTIAPFPVMTDPSFAEFFHFSPLPSVEAQSYNGLYLTYGYGVYTVHGDAGWMRYTNWYLPVPLHGDAYLHPYPWWGHDLRNFEEVFLYRWRPMTVCYSLCTSCVGAKYGREGHEAVLEQVDQLTRYLMLATRGRARFTLLSDHGLAFIPYGNAQRICLRQELSRLGYRSAVTLIGPRDVVIPEFGLVSCACLYTKCPEAVARDVLKIDGVELSAYMDGDEVVVLRDDGAGRIRHAGDRFSYSADVGDPLELRPILARLKNENRVTEDGFVEDRDLFQATVDATYPDAVARLWRAFHGLVKRTPQVYVSERDGYFSGDSTMDANITMVGIHGNLRQPSTCGFAMTMAGNLSPVHRQIDLRRELIALGVPVPGK